MEVMPDIDKIYSDITSLRIQGATNVALAVLDALAQTIREQPDISCFELTKIGQQLAYARPTEPLAQNAVRFISEGCTEEAAERIEKYKQFIEDGKVEIPKQGSPLLLDGGSYLTLCHSSTVVRLFEAARKKGAIFAMYVAETRPRFQGRVTAKELIEAGFDDVTMVIDDVAVALIEGRIGKIDAVFIGADLLSEHGFVNKVGSLAVTEAAARKHIPVCVVSTLLKYAPSAYSPAMVEKRSSEEIWPDAPKSLKFYAPAFDYVPYEKNVTVVTEVGIVSGKKVKTAAKETYPFIFDPGHDKRLYYGKSV